MDKNRIRVIITGSTGMVGEGVLHVCLNDPNIEKILVINRRSIGLNHPKLTEIIHSDFFNLSAIENHLSGYDACYFCLGVSSVGMKEDEYYRLTYTLTMHFAETVNKLNPGMTFCYVSGAGTDSTEKGKMMWARVKGKTENDLSKLGFKSVYLYRPGFMKPIKGLKNTHKYYNYTSWMLPIGKLIYPKGFNTLEKVAKSMISVTLHGSNYRIIEGNEFDRLASLIEN